MKAIETYYKGYHFRSRLEARWAVFFDACGAEWEYEPEGFVLDDGTCYLPDFVLYNVGGRRIGGPMHNVDSEERCDNKLYVEVKGVMDEAAYKKVKGFAFSERSLRWVDRYEFDKQGLIYYLRHELRDYWRSKKYNIREKVHEWACRMRKGVMEDYIKNPILIVGRIPEGDTVSDLIESMDRFSREKHWSFYNLFTVDFNDGFGGYLFASNNGISLDDESRNYEEAVNELRTIKAYNAARQARFEHNERIDFND